MSNRDKLLRVLADIEAVAADEAISPTPYGHLAEAASEVRSALQFALDLRERDGVAA